jgi:hypothetical protein
LQAWHHGSGDTNDHSNKRAKAVYHALEHHDKSDPASVIISSIVVGVIAIILDIDGTQTRIDRGNSNGQKHT